MAAMSIPFARSNRRRGDGLITAKATDRNLRSKSSRRYGNGCGPRGELADGVGIDGFSVTHHAGRGCGQTRLLETPLARRVAAALGAGPVRPRPCRRSLGAAGSCNQQTGFRRPTAYGEDTHTRRRDRHRHAAIDPRALCLDSGVLGGVGPFRSRTTSCVSTGSTRSADDAHSPRTDDNQ